MAISILFSLKLYPRMFSVLIALSCTHLWFFHWYSLSDDPLSRIVGTFVKHLLKSEKETDSDEEIILVAEKALKMGH